MIANISFYIGWHLVGRFEKQVRQDLNVDPPPVGDLFCQRLSFKVFSESQRETTSFCRVVVVSIVRPSVVYLYLMRK